MRILLLCACLLRSRASLGEWQYGSIYDVVSQAVILRPLRASCGSLPGGCPP